MGEIPVYALWSFIIRHASSPPCEYMPGHSPLALLPPAASSGFFAVKVDGAAETVPGLEGSKVPVQMNTSLNTEPGREIERQSVDIG